MVGREKENSAGVEDEWKELKDCSPPTAYYFQWTERHVD
jgi:hypothetical protein